MVMEVETTKIEKKPDNTKIIDLVSPIGKGQRALISFTSKSRKNNNFQNIAQSITANHPDVI